MTTAVATYTAPTFYNFGHEQGYKLYGDRPIAGPNAAVECTGALIREYADAPIHMFGTVKFMDFENVMLQMGNMKGITLVAAEPFVINQTNYDPHDMHKMYALRGLAIAGTNAGTHVMPTGLKILYDQLQAIGDADAIKARLAEDDPFCVSHEDSAEGEGFRVKAKETETYSHAQVWYKIGGLTCAMQIERNNTDGLTIVMATRD